MLHSSRSKLNTVRSALERKGLLPSVLSHSRRYIWYYERTRASEWQNGASGCLPLLYFNNSILSNIFSRATLERNCLIRNRLLAVLVHFVLALLMWLIGCEGFGKHGSLCTGLLALPLKSTRRVTKCLENKTVYLEGYRRMCKNSSKHTP